MTGTDALPILVGKPGSEAALAPKRRDNAPTVYSYEGLTPVVHRTSFVHPTAVLIGDVIIGAALLHRTRRLPKGGIWVGLRSATAQTSRTIASFTLSPGKDVILEPDSHIGHGAVLHGCTTRRNALVGMNSVIMDGAVIGEDSFVAAMTFVQSEFQVPPRTLVAGIPAKILRELTDDEIAWKGQGTKEYQRLAVRSLASCQAAAALETPEPERARHPKSDTKPLAERRK